MRLGSYELTHKLGAGGMAEVWAARRGAVGGAAKTFAVKRLARHLADIEEYRAMFLAEARLSMLLTHSNIVQVFDAGEQDGEVYLAMEYVDGVDLAVLTAKLAEAGESLPIPVAAHIVAELLTALAYAHDLRDEDDRQMTVVHRDVSPQNVMISLSGEVKLMDFGIARLRSEDTSGLHIKGKVRYMPPEQLRGESREPTIDLFAAGAILHELLDGARFRNQASDDARLYGMVLDGEVPPLAREDLPEALDALRLHLLAADPEQRIGDAHDALDELYAWSGYRNARIQLGRLVRRLRGVEAPRVGGTTRLTRLGDEAPASPSTQLRPAEGSPEISSTRLLAQRPAANGDATGTQMLPGHGAERLPGDPAHTGEDGGEEAGEETDLRARGGQTQREPRGSAASRPLASRVALGALALAVGAGLFGAQQAGWFAGERSAAVEASDAAPANASPDEVTGDATAPTSTDETKETNEADKAGQPSESEDPPPPAGPRQARVVGDGFSGYAGFRQPAMAKLEAAGITYDYSDAPQPGGRLQMLASGEAEFALTSLDRVLIERPAGKIVAVVDVSTGSDALVLDTVHYSKLRQLADLPAVLTGRGPTPTLAYAGGTPSEYLALHLDDLFRTLDRHNLQVASDFANAEAVWQALSDADSRVALGLLWEPWVSKARKAGMTVAVSTRDLPRTVVHVLVASDAVLARDPALVDAVVLAAYRQATGLLREPRRLRQQIATETGLDPSELDDVVDGVCILTSLGAEPWLSPRSGEGDGEQPALIDAAIRRTWATLALHGQVQGKLGEPGDRYDARAVRAAAQDTRGMLKASGLSHAGIDRTCLEPSAARPRKTTAQTLELGGLELPRTAGIDQPWFEPGWPRLAVEVGATLDEIIRDVAAFNPATVSLRVVGYGDEAVYKGRYLGRRRAEAIAKLLEERGVLVPVVTEGRDVRGAPARRVDFELVIGAQ